MPPKPAAAQKNGPFGLLRPLLLLSYSLYYIIPTVISLLVTLQLSTFFHIDEFKDAWFARFWAFLGPQARKVAEPSVTTLLSNNARGVCLDIGPGNGQWLSLFSKALNPKVTKIYGVEPNFGMHKTLRQNAIKAELGDVYEIIGCGAEELNTKGGIPTGSIDTIITVQCLCSIPTPETIIRELYPLLKPGGQWLVYEHVTTKYHGHFVEYWQKLLNVVWPHCFNGCSIRRPTDEWLLQAGEWKDVSLKPVAGEGPYDTVPHIFGTLTKHD